MRPYLRAKSRADERLKSSSLDYTIIRPGSLTEDEGKGTIEAAEKLGSGVRSPAKTSPAPSPRRSKTKTHTTRRSRSCPERPLSPRRSDGSRRIQEMTFGKSRPPLVPDPGQRVLLLSEDGSRIEGFRAARTDHHGDG